MHTFNLRYDREFVNICKTHVVRNGNVKSIQNCSSVTKQIFFCHLRCCGVRRVFRKLPDMKDVADSAAAAR